MIKSLIISFALMFSVSAFGGHHEGDKMKKAGNEVAEKGQATAADKEKDAKKALADVQKMTDEARKGEKSKDDKDKPEKK